MSFSDRVEVNIGRKNNIIVQTTMLTSVCILVLEDEGVIHSLMFFHKDF